MKLLLIHRSRLDLTALCSRLVPLFLWIISRTVEGLNLDGTPGAYIQYPPWKPCHNGSLSLEFKTHQEQALLLYFNKGEYLFFELKLLKGSIRLRVGVDEKTIIIRGGHSLNDGIWHTVEIKQDGDVSSLVVDKVIYSRTRPGLVENLISSTSPEDTFIFIGGLPEEYNVHKFKTLALPSVVFEPRFRGSVRNLFYRNCGEEPFRPEALEMEGILTRDEDLCERGNPCLNGGQCLTTDNGLYCDCLATEYKGDRCDIQKIPSDATFLGAQFISYNLSRKGDVLVSNHDRITLDFRTKQPSSLLFYTGNSKDHITVGLVDGAIFVTVDLGSGMEEMEIRPHNERFDDNRWHQVLIRREAKEVTVEIDGMYRKRGSTTGKFVRLSSSVLYVAGSPDTQTLAGSRVRTNFKGCMRKVKYHADSIRLDLTEMARRQHGLLTVVGDIIFDKCQELVETQPVTFSTPDSYLIVTTWDRPSLKGSLAFQFRTVEEGGLIMYSNGNRDSHDFFAMEILDGHLYLVLDMGSGVVKIKASKITVTDGRPHDVYFEFTENKGYISIDGQKELFSSHLVSDRFDLHGELYIGGVGPAVNVSTLPHELWSARLGLSYVGCIQDLVINSKLVDLLAASRLSNRTDIQGHCQRAHTECSSHPCNHGGKCVEGWNRFSCDCRATGFIGSVCQTATATLRFDGTQYVRVFMPKESLTQAEDISLRFRTMHQNGLLFQTIGRGGDSLKLYLEMGILSFSIMVGDGYNKLSVGHTLHDDRWHTVFIKRREHTVQISIDLDRPVTDQVRGMDSTLSIRQIFVGHSKTEPTELSHIHYKRRSKRERNLMSNDVDQSLSGFVGSMQSFVFNGNQFFELANSESEHHMEVTAKFSTDEYVVRDPVTFKSADAFALLTTLQVNAEFSISLQIKTTEADGILLYNAGEGSDFFAMELHQGFLFYVYNMGEGGQQVKANINKPINDNQWHEIRLLRTDTIKQLLRVDANTPTVDDLSGNRNVMFDLDGPLYIGGVRKTLYPTLPKLIQSRHGFLGCLGSLDLNGYLPNLLREASPIHEAVGDGCKGPLKKCVNDSCSHHGRCVQQWTSYSCDCDMTSYTGSICQDESISYKFGAGRGLMTFTYPEEDRPSTNSESVAFGFRTFQENAVLLRMDSTTYDDFIQMELSDGKMFVSYNMGTLDHPLGNFFQKLNDGKYHIVRFTRDGANSTLQIDFGRPQNKNPTGNQAHTFNNQAYIRIGGNVADDGNIIDYFEGSLSGLVVNGIHMFQRAKENDPRIHLTGNVQLSYVPKEQMPIVLVEDMREKMQSTEGRVTPYDFKLPKHFQWKNLRTKSSSNLSVPPTTLGPKIENELDSYPMQYISPGRKKREPNSRFPKRDRVAYESSTPGTQEGKTDTWNIIQEILAEGLSKIPSFVEKESETLGTNKESTDSPVDRNEDENSDCDPCIPLALTKKPMEISERNSGFNDRQLVDDFPQTDDLFKDPLDEGSNNNRWDEGMRDDDGYNEDENEHKMNEYLARQGRKRAHHDSYPFDDNENDYDYEDEMSGSEGSGVEDEPMHANQSSWSKKETTTTPHKVKTQHQPTHQFGSEQEPEEEWNYYEGQTTPREGVTDDIIYAGSGCHFDDEEDCPSVGSGNVEEIITPVIILKTTTPVPTTTTTTTTTQRPPSNCIGQDCETSSRLKQETTKKGKDGGQGNSNGHILTPRPGEEATAQPGKSLNEDDKDDDKGINLALIIGITVSVLLAVIVLIIALYKLRSRDEGTYKVDETQNFSNLQSKKTNGNGALMASAETGTGKRGKKKDVKEWYV